MKAVVWILFYASLAGMVLSSLLRSSATREVLIALWVQTSVRAESHSPTAALNLARTFIFAVYCNPDSTLSKKKISFLTLIGSFLWYFAMDISGGDFLTDANALFPFWVVPFITVVGFGIGAVLNFPFHFLFEYALAIWAVSVARRTDVRDAFHLLILIGMAMLAYYAVPLLLIVPIGLLQTFEQKFGFVGPPALPWVMRHIIHNDLPLVLVAVTAIVSSGFALITSVIAILLVRSKNFLKALALLSEKLAASSYDRIFAFSVLTFSLATGLMQAWTF
jgi:hypothetical protein